MKEINQKEIVSKIDTKLGGNLTFGTFIWNILDNKFTPDASLIEILNNIGLKQTDEFGSFLDCLATEASTIRGLLLDIPLGRDEINTPVNLKIDGTSRTAHFFADVFRNEQGDAVELHGVLKINHVINKINESNKSTDFAKNVHDINNLLTAIITEITLKTSPDSVDDKPQYLKNIENYAFSIARKLATISRQNSKFK